MSTPSPNYPSPNYPNYRITIRADRSCARDTCETANFSQAEACATVAQASACDRRTRIPPLAGFLLEASPRYTSQLSSSRAQRSNDSSCQNGRPLRSSMRIDVRYPDKQQRPLLEMLEVHGILERTPEIECLASGAGQFAVGKIQEKFNLPRIEITFSLLLRLRGDK